MSGFAFLAADPASHAWRSPLARATAHAPAGIRDITADVGERDMSALGHPSGIAGLELSGERAERTLRRVTDLDLDRLPALGPVARVRALVDRPAGDRFELWFAQEYADYVAAVVIDAWAGLE
jgi:sarcosine oxidase gamma subunit